MDRFCSNCGIKLEQGVAFCGFCGAKIENDSSVQHGSNSIQHNVQPLVSQGRYFEDKTIVEMFFKQNGRLNRLRYFKRSLVVGVIESLLIVLGAVILLEPWEDTNSAFEGYSIICGLIALYPEFCLNVRRLQDLDKGKDMAYWFAGAGALTVIGSSLESGKGAIVALMYLGCALYLTFAEGTKGENQYGSDPLK